MSTNRTEVFQPDVVTDEHVDRARGRLVERGNAGDLPLLDEVRLETVEEGPSVQTLHVGPFETEGETVACLHAFLRAESYEPAGSHHEVYLSDLRRADPERLRTVVRQPVRPAPG